MNFSDAQPLRGELTITSKDRAGNITMLLKDHNLIVLNGRNDIANSLISGVCPIINTIAFGTGGTVSGSSSQVIAVQPTELTVINAIPNLVLGTDFTFNIDHSAIDAISASVSPKIIYTILIPEVSALNGYGINELALMLNSTTPSAFSIKRFSTITKSSSISISVAWILYF